MPISYEFIYSTNIAHLQSIDIIIGSEGKYFEKWKFFVMNPQDKRGDHHIKEDIAVLYTNIRVRNESRV